MQSKFLKLGVSAVVVHAFFCTLGILCIVLIAIAVLRTLNKGTKHNVALLSLDEALQELSKYKNPHPIKAVIARIITSAGKGSNIIEKLVGAGDYEGNIAFNVELSVGPAIKNVKIPCCKDLESQLTDNSLPNKALLIGPSRTGKTFFGNVLIGQNPGKNILIKIQASQLFSKEFTDMHKSTLQAIIDKVRHKGFVPILLLDELDKVTINPDSAEQAMALVDSIGNFESYIYATANESPSFQRNIKQALDNPDANNTLGLFLKRLLCGGNPLQFSLLTTSHALEILKERISKSAIDESGQRNIEHRLENTLKQNQLNMEHIKKFESSYINDYKERLKVKKELDEKITQLQNSTQLIKKKYSIKINPIDNTAIEGLQTISENILSTDKNTPYLGLLSEVDEEQKTILEDSDKFKLGKIYNKTDDIVASFNTLKKIGNASGYDTISARTLHDILQCYSSYIPEHWNKEITAIISLLKSSCEEIKLTIPQLTNNDTSNVYILNKMLNLHIGEQIETESIETILGLGEEFVALYNQLSHKKVVALPTYKDKLEQDISDLYLNGAMIRVTNAQNKRLASYYYTDIKGIPDDRLKSYVERHSLYEATDKTILCLDESFARQYIEKQVLTKDQCDHALTRALKEIRSTYEKFHKLTQKDQEKKLNAKDRPEDKTKCGFFKGDKLQTMFDLAVKTAKKKYPTPKTHLQENEIENPEKQNSP